MATAQRQHWQTFLSALLCWHLLGQIPPTPGRQRCGFLKALGIELNRAKNCIFRDYIEPKASGIRGRITKAFDDDEAPRIVRGIHESALAKSQVAVGADGITAKVCRMQFRDAFFPFESNAVNPKRDSVFAGRCRGEYQQLSDRLPSPQPGKVSHSIGGGIRVQMSHRIDAHFSVFALAIARRIGVNVDFGSDNTELQPA